MMKGNLPDEIYLCKNEKFKSEIIKFSKGFIKFLNGECAKRFFKKHKIKDAVNDER